VITYCETVNEILSGNLRELNGFLYVSDGIRWHRSAQFKQWCDQYNIELCESPGYSLILMQLNYVVDATSK
jgi:hypothetical protein